MIKCEEIHQGGLVMIILTGDTHRDFERIFEFCEEYEITEGDIIVILGDAGINYYLDESDEHVKDKLAELPCQLFLVHGNHEERPYMIDTYEEREWHGGMVYMEDSYPNLIFAKDGEIYDFDGKKTMVIGGAYSIDKMIRLQGGAQWFDTEQPDEIIKGYVEKQLEKSDWKVDYVFSHTAPLKFEPIEEFIPGIDQAYIDKSTEEWLDSIEDRLKYDRWFLGHYHCNKYQGQITILFEEFEELPS